MTFRQAKEAMESLQRPLSNYPVRWRRLRLAQLVKLVMANYPRTFGKPIDDCLDMRLRKSDSYLLRMAIALGD